jgi:hypothetical protein
MKRDLCNPRGQAFITDHLETAFPTSGLSRASGQLNRFPQKRASLPKRVNFLIVGKPEAIRLSRRDQSCEVGISSGKSSTGEMRVYEERSGQAAADYFPLCVVN